jgi:hypothetical protein
MSVHIYISPACYQGGQSGKRFIKGHRVREYDQIV